MKQQFSVSTFVSVVAIFAVPLVFIWIIGGGGKNLFSTSLPFDTIEPENQIQGTQYVLDYLNHNLDLRNLSTQKRIRIVQGYSPVAAPPAYTRLWYNDSRIYLITRLASGGNSGANWYRVFKISGDVVELTQGGDPENGLSCIDPRLGEGRDKSVLQFEHSVNCADSAAARQTYEIVLS